MSPQSKELKSRYALCPAHEDTRYGDELVELVYKYYPKLDAKYKGLMPFRSVYIPGKVDGVIRKFVLIMSTDHGVSVPSS